LSKEVADGPERYRIPAAAAAKPTAARKSNKPMPGLPPGNVEYSLCSAYLRRDPRTYARVRYADMRPTETPHCGIFSYHFWGMSFACGLLTHCCLQFDDSAAKTNRDSLSAIARP
jgi:hypothetical protein